MKTQKVDVAIIGAGTSGLNARREVEKAGKSWVLIESGPYGTTCARVGCMPSKLLIAAADRAHEAATSGEFGVHADGLRIDGRRVMERVRAERDRFAGFVVEDTEALDESRRIRSHARFTGPTTLETEDGQKIEAASVVIASGSSPWLPPPFDTIAEHVMVNDDVFELKELPASMAVIGTGIIGLELGQALSRLGVSVTFFSPFGSLGAFSDPEIQSTVRETLTEELDLELNAMVSEAAPCTGGVYLRWQRQDGSEQEREFETILVSAGRRANIADLNLEATGLTLDDKGVPEWDACTTQCGDQPIFMAGDVSGHRALLHEASDEGRIAGANASLYPHIETHHRRTPLAVAFTSPQMGIVGNSYSDLDPDAIEIGEVSYANQGRARVIGRNQGLVRIYAMKKCCTITGAEMFGPGVEHMAHLLAWAVQQKMTVQNALRMPFYHPVLEEGLRTALVELSRKLKVSGDCPCEDMATAAGT